MNKSESKYFNTAVKMDLALISLLKKKTFEYITVSEICERAGVNRSTFYLHYENIGDLLEETARYLIDDFLTYFGEDMEDVPYRLTNCELSELNFICDKYLTPYLTYIRENKEVFSTALSNRKPLGFDAVYKRMFENIFDPILERFHYPNEDRKYVMMYYLNGITAIIAEWLKDNCSRAISDISGIIQACIFGLGGGLPSLGFPKK
ncbi:MAG: TetR/AcrR family transcriptional regulator [Clostridia bacterium]|nr:TetR/AcrR family transcriptional regulator [Clostridia bacterium]